MIWVVGGTWHGWMVQPAPPLLIVESGEAVGVGLLCSEGSVTLDLDEQPIKWQINHIQKYNIATL